MKSSKGVSRRKRKEMCGRVMYDMIKCAGVWADENNVLPEDIAMVLLACALNIARWELRNSQSLSDVCDLIAGLEERVGELLAAEAGSSPSQKDLAAFALRYWGKRA